MSENALKSESTGTNALLEELCSKHELSLADDDAANAYYRSLLFTAKSGVNPLVSAAQPILSLLNRIKSSPDKVSYTAFQKHLIHEFKAFETHSSYLEYDDEIIVLSRCLLCAVLTEFIDDRDLKEITHFRNKYIHLLSSEDLASSEQHFCLIIKRLIQDPKKYVDLLELIYFCLSIGFRGNYRHTWDGNTKVDNIMDDVYDIIQPNRDEPSQQLFIHVKHPGKIATQKKHHSLTVIILLAISIVGSFYLGCSYLINISAKPLVKKAHIERGPKLRSQ